jgi:hypothetical protein
MDAIEPAAVEHGTLEVERMPVPTGQVRRERTFRQEMRTDGTDDGVAHFALAIPPSRRLGVGLVRQAQIGAQDTDT